MKRVDFSKKIDVINGLQLCIDTFALLARSLVVAAKRKEAHSWAMAVPEAICQSGVR